MFYRPVKRDESVLRTRIKEIAWNRVRYGYNRIAVLLRRDGWMVNHKRVRRLYREENLTIRTKTPKRRRAASVARSALYPPRQIKAGPWISCTTCSPTAPRSGS